MHSRTIILAIGLLAAPLSLLAAPETAPTGAGGFWLAAAAGEETVNGRVLTEAPVPNIGPGGVAPVDRVAGAGSRTLDAGPANSTPFSSTPTGTLSGGSDTGSQRDGALASGQSGATPNLGR